MMIRHTHRGIRSEHVSSFRFSAEPGPSMGTHMNLSGVTYYRQPGEKLNRFIARVISQRPSGVACKIIVRWTNGLVDEVIDGNLVPVN